MDGMYSSEFCVLIMAGGKGTRFWPWSTDSVPKQFLPLVGEKTMLQLTFDRAKKIVGVDRIFVMTGERYVSLVKEQLPEVSGPNIILEPMSKNTAPAINLACVYIQQLFGDCILATLPSDHLVDNDDEFAKSVVTAKEHLTDNNGDGIVAIGVKPERPETNYGYIKLSLADGAEDRKGQVARVERFVEKPSLELAKKYVCDGGYLWNVGVLVFGIEYMLTELEVNVKSMFDVLTSLPRINECGYWRVLKDAYERCPSISIDYAVMERAKNIYVVLADYGWDDVGTWESVERYMPKDKMGNVSRGDVDVVDSKNCVVYGGKKRIVAVDVDDLYIIDGPDALVVCAKDSIDKIREYR